MLSRYRYLILCSSLLLTYFGPPWLIIINLAILGFVLGSDVHIFLLQRKLKQLEMQFNYYEKQQKARLRKLNPHKWGR